MKVWGQLGNATALRSLEVDATAQSAPSALNSGEPLTQRRAAPHFRHLAHAPTTHPRSTMGWDPGSEKDLSRRFASSYKIARPRQRYISSRITSKTLTMKSSIEHKTCMREG